MIIRRSKFYYVSNSPDIDGQLVKPSKSNELANWAHSYLGKSKFSHISVFPSISQALMSDSSLEGSTLYVYSPQWIGGSDVIKKPSEEELPGSSVTGESWILVDCRMSLISTIKVGKKLRTKQVTWGY